MSLPQRVQEQLQAAEALEAADQAARAKATQVVANVADLTAPPPTAQASAPPPAPATQAPPPAPKEDFEQKYRTLQGMYNADVTRLTQSVKDMGAKVAAIEAKAAAPAEAKPAVDPKDIENFGAEMMDMVQRYVTGAVKSLEGRIAAVEANVNGVAEQTATSAEKQFYTLLTQLVPDWKAVNADQKWLAWLGQVDPVYGLPRQAALDNAFKNGDAQQVANVFNAFKASIPPAPPAPTLDSQITPDGAGNPAPPAAAPKPIISTKAITDFYNDVGRGRYLGRDAEQAAIEAQINEAVAEGRVR